MFILIYSSPLTANKIFLVILACFIIVSKDSNFLNVTLFLPPIIYLSIIVLPIYIKIYFNTFEIEIYEESICKAFSMLIICDNFKILLILHHNKILFVWMCSGLMASVVNVRSICIYFV